MSVIGREREQALLTTVYEREGAQFLVLYGRRRIGKTTLIQHWSATKLSEGEALYWVATQTSATNQLRAFSQALFRHINPAVSPEPTFSYGSWETAFAEAARQAAEERLVLILDEFTYVLQADPEVASILQKIWDQQLKGSQVFLILSGSLAGMIERSILDYQAPLYGRATARLKLAPLSFGALADFLPKMTPEQRVAVYAVTGGVPAYLTLFDGQKNLRENLAAHFVTPANLMLNDAVFLLREQLTEPRNYMALLEALAAGHHNVTDIARMAGLERSNANKYLSVLRELGYVERRVPATVRRPEKSRQGRYVITDAYLRFYFRFLRPYLSEIEMGRLGAVLSLLEEHLTAFIGTYTFEEICREWVRIKADLGELPFLPDRVGSYWGKAAQVDVVAISWREKQILLGECKWGERPVERPVLDALEARADKVVPKKGNWQVHYALFARSDLNRAARKKAGKLDALLVDVAQLEADDLRWIQSHG